MFGQFGPLSNRATQVEVIIIAVLPDYPFITRILLSTFPNLRNISAQRDLEGRKCGFPYTRSSVPEMPAVRYVSGVGNCTLVTQLMDLNVGNELETLDLDFENFQSCENIIAQFHSMPNLQNLYITRASINAQVLETLHLAIESLETLVLSRVLITPCTIPTNITPAGITHLEFKYQRYQSVEVCVAMYLYLTQKYTNLNKVYYRDPACSDVADEKFDADQRETIYNTGLRGFLEMIGTIQRKLFLNNFSDHINIFRYFDAIGSRLDYVSLVQCVSELTLYHLAHSQQFLSIKEISIVNTRIYSTIPFESMRALTTLEIHCTDGNSRNFRLADCLDGCPGTIKELRLKKIDNIPLNYQGRFQHLENLELGFDAIPNQVADFVSNGFPNLYNLSIRGKVQGDLHIAVRNSNFQAGRFQIHKDRASRNLKFSFAFKAANINQTTFYGYNYNRGNRPYLRIFQVDHAAVVGLPMLSIECFTEMQTGMPPHGEVPPMRYPCTCKFKLSKYAM